jgi:ABC-type multidrug transport system fused ATPase/permease subunit
VSEAPSSTSKASKSPRSKRGGSLLRLLLPHARPHFGALVLVACLGSLTAFAQGGMRLLLLPTWRLLFPTESTVVVAEKAAPQEGFLGTLAVWRHAAVEWVLGTEGGPSGPDEQMSLVLRVALLLCALALIGAITEYLFTVLSRLVALRMVVHLRIELARHLIGLSLRYHGKRHFGDLLSRVSSDVSTTLNVVNLGLRDLVQAPLLGLVALGGALFVAPAVTLVVLVGLPILMFPIGKLMKRVRKGSRRSQTQLGASLQALSQMFQGVRTVKAFRAEERQLERYRALNDQYIGATMKMVRATAISRGWTILYTFAGSAALLVLVAYLTIQERQISEGGEMLVFFMMVATLYSAIKDSTRALAKIEEAVGASDRLLELLDEKPDIVESPRPRKLQGLGSGIRFEGVSFRYPSSEYKAVDGLDLEVRAGETLALVGPSGAGKSTILDLIARFVDPSQGRVLVNDVDLREVGLDAWAGLYAMVNQEPFLFHATIEENIRYGRDGSTREDVERAAQMAGIHEFIVGLPEGYATDVADMGTRLSGGQRQRIAIARAFLREAPLLLLDEATSALDSESEQVVQDALERLMQGHTVIVVAHRLTTVRGADRIAVVDGGRLVELGTHDELIEGGGVYSRLYAVQFSE